MKGAVSKTVDTRFLKLLTFSLSLLASSRAYAARPLVTDDARIVEAKACQVETWVRRNQASTEYWAVPACNPTGNAELTIGGARTREQGSSHLSDVQFQAKTLFRKLDTNSWGVGAAVGYLEPKAAPDRRFGANLYGYVPASFSFLDDAFIVHANVGTLRPENESRRLTWGLGTETRLYPSLIAIVEVFRQQASGPHYQAGLRYWLIADRVQIDATVGDRLGHSNGERWFSIGVRLLSPPFLP